MKKPSLVPAMLAAASMLGGLQSIPMGSTLRPSQDMNTLYAPTLRTARRAKGRVAMSQRQIRKDRRRANAAGKRNAFKS